MKQQIQASANHLWSSVNKSLEQTKRQMSTPDTTVTDEQDGVQAQIESVIRVMFGSCTVGDVIPITPDNDKTSDIGSPVVDSPASSRDKSQSTCEPVSPTKHEHFLYTKSRAEKAVCLLRDQLEGARESRSPLGAVESNVPGLFPASPPNMKLIRVPDRMVDPSSHSTGNDGEILNDASFDDGISAISQDTIDEMARVYAGRNIFLERVHSDITQDPYEIHEESWKITVDEESWKFKVNPKGRVSPMPRRADMSPLRAPSRGRSHATANTRSSKFSKSTMSSQTNEFANVWKIDEEKYWQEVVEEQNEDYAQGSFEPSNLKEKIGKAREQHRRMSRELKTKRDGTITTVHSSDYSGLASQEKLVSRTYPDRSMNVITMPARTEMGQL